LQSSGGIVKLSTVQLLFATPELSNSIQLRLLLKELQFNYAKQKIEKNFEEEAL
jgi:hypothetical protein